MIFAVDTSTLSVGLALFDGTQVIGEMNWQTKHNHTIELAPAIEYLFFQCGIQKKELKACAIALGPGSFTSLRIGLSLVKGIALSLRIPVIGIPTLDFLAQAQPAKNIPLLAILQAGRSRFAVGKYKLKSSSWIKDGESTLLSIEEISDSIESPTYICGELSAEDRQILNRKRRNIVLGHPVHSVRRASFLASMAWKRYKVNDFDEIDSLAPIYLHIADSVL
ncbi:MAG: tRNA (adenosine(37)-N6)-threonylcarbamoyltransferase complex dimerization subunit type 1 TsaB [Anaerolineaceae bacterium]